MTAVSFCELTAPRVEQRVVQAETETDYWCSNLLLDWTILERTSNKVSMLRKKPTADAMNS